MKDSQTRMTYYKLDVFREAYGKNQRPSSTLGSGYTHWGCNMPSSDPLPHFVTVGGGSSPCTHCHNLKTAWPCGALPTRLHHFLQKYINFQLSMNFEGASECSHVPSILPAIQQLPTSNGDTGRQLTECLQHPSDRGCSALKGCNVKK